jgi:hypothetical protein
MKKEIVCNVQNYSVLIPYKDLEKMLQSANKIEEMVLLAKRIEERCACMQLLYSEMLEKICEMERYL